MPPYLLPAPYDHDARRARFVAAVGVLIGSMLIWGSLAALNRWVLGFSAWPERGAVAIGRVVMADAPARSLSPTLALPPVAAGREISLLDGSGLGAAGSVITDVGAGGGDRRGASPQGVRSVPDGRPVGVLAPGSDGNTTPPLIVPVPGPPGAARTVTPVNIDTDNDGLPDAWEISNGLNPNSPADATADSDGDGIPNIVEFTLKSDPQTADTGRDIRRDTDGDGVSDEDEIARGTDPAVADPPAAEPAPGGEGEPAPVPAADDAPATEPSGDAEPATEPAPGEEPATSDPAGDGEPAAGPGAGEGPSQDEPAGEPQPQDLPGDGDGTPAPEPGSETQPVAEPAPAPVEGAPDCEPVEAQPAAEAPGDEDDASGQSLAAEHPAASAPAGT